MRFLPARVRATSDPAARDTGGEMNAKHAYRIRRGVKMGRHVLNNNRSGVPVFTLQITLIDTLDDLGFRAYKRTIERGTNHAR